MTQQLKNGQLLKGDRSVVSQQVAQYVINAIESLATEKSGPIVLGLCGGTSPDSLYQPFVEALRTLKPRVIERLRLLHVDERKLPLDNAESNWGKLYANIFQPAVGQGLLVPAQFIAYPVLETPECAVELMNHRLAEVGGGFDIAILASGGDTHVAGCFPGRPASTTNACEFIFEPSRPKPPAEGITASLALLARTRYGVLLFFGVNKQADLQTFIADTEQMGACPVAVGHRFERLLAASDQA